MAIFRGIGGAGDSTTDATVTAVTEQATNAANSATSAASSASSASSSASAASTSASNAASSASSASTSAANAATSASNASSSESAAASSASDAASSATDAQTAQTAAEAAESNAATSASAAASSASSASSSASSASSSASTATTKASEAAASASAASTSASNAATSETNAASSASSASASAAAAAASFDAFDDIYLGAKASDPTVDNDGDPLSTGDQYFNTGANELRVWNGSSWQAASTVGGTVTNLTVTNNPTLSAGTANGVTYLNGSNVLTSGSALTFDGSTLNVTGDVVADGLTIDGVIEAVGSTAIVFLMETDSVDKNTYFRNGNGGTFNIRTVNDAKTVSTNRFGLNHATGDISFYEDTGTTPKFFWDASAESLGIGTSSPAYKLDVNGNANITGNTTLGDASTDTVTVNGYMGVGGTLSANVGLLVSSTSLTGGSQAGFSSAPTFTSSATSAGYAAQSTVKTAAASFTMANAYSYYIVDATKGAGSTITNLHGLYIADQTQGTNNYGIRSAVSSGTNKWNIYASGTAANYFAGSVGIGTSSPDKKFTLLDGATYFKIYQNTTNEMMLTVGASERMLFGIDGAEKMRIDSSGNVGIGTSSPASKLNVKDNVNSAIGILVENSNTGGASSAVLDLTSASQSAFRLQQYIDGSARIRNIANAPLIFYTNNVERMELDSSGNLGLGVTPSAWGSYKALDISYTGSLYGSSGTGRYSVWANNNYRDSGGVNKYKVNGFATQATQEDNGSFYWRQAPSGTANATVPFTQTMTLDASGNLGIGATTSGGKLTIKNPSVSGEQDIFVIQGATNTTSIAKLTFDQSVDQFKISANTSAGFLVFGTGSGGTERARITSSGNVGIGTDSPGAKLDIRLASDRGLYVEGATSDVVYLRSYQGGNSSNLRELGFKGSDIRFETGATTGSTTTERMRITSGGDLLVGTTVTPSSSSSGCSIEDGSMRTSFGAYTGSGFHLYFINGNGTVGTISSNGSSTSYNTSSDYRLKEDWVAVADASTRVNALNPVNFAWKATGDRVDGFLAHELAEVVPEAVTGEKDAVELVDIKDEEGNVTGQEERPVYQGIDQSKLVPLLTAALQEALAKIESLTARVSALEGN